MAISLRKNVLQTTIYLFFLSEKEHSHIVETAVY